MFKDAFDQLTRPPGVLALLGLGAIGIPLVASWRRDGPIRMLSQIDRESSVGLFAVAWTAIVGVMAEVGFAGNPRYLVPALAALAVCGAITAMRIAGSSPVRQAVAITVIVVAAIAYVAGTIRTQVNEVTNHARLATHMRHDLAALHCPGLRWTFVANRSTLAQLTGQSVGESTHPSGFHVPAGRLVYCARLDLPTP
jgi:hypothetical protein